MRMRSARVTLRGAVESHLERGAAVHDTRHVDGVFNVVDELDVHPPLPDRRADDEIRGAVLRRLIDDPRVPSNHLEVSVSRGVVTLTGRVENEAQRAGAEKGIASLVGVTGVVNLIEVRQRRKRRRTGAQDRVSARGQRDDALAEAGADGAAAGEPRGCVGVPGEQAASRRQDGDEDPE
jgi:BON domain